MIIRSTLYGIDNPKYQCTNCLAQFPKHRGETRKTMIRQERVKKACYNTAREARAVTPYSNQLQTVKFYRCPGNYFNEQVVQYLSMFHKFEANVMSFPGNFLDQPAKLIEIMNVIRAHVNDKIERDRINAERKSKTKR